MQKQQFKILVVFLPIFVGDTKIFVYGLMANSYYQRFLEYRKIPKLSIMECFATIVSDIQSSIIVAKLSILGTAGILDTPLNLV